MAPPPGRNNPQGRPGPSPAPAFSDGPTLGNSIAQLEMSLERAQMLDDNIQQLELSLESLDESYNEARAPLSTARAFLR